jgi:hypothetical protein
MGRAVHLLAFPALLVLSTCAHELPIPPPGMARLIVVCCELVDEDGGASHLDCAPKREIDGSAVWVDGEERGTCASSRRNGAVLSTGRHVIQIKVSLEEPLQAGGCCVDAGAYVTVRSGEVHQQEIGLKRLRPAD